MRRRSYRKGVGVVFVVMVGEGEVAELCTVSNFGHAWRWPAPSTPSAPAPEGAPEGKRPPAPDEWIILTPLDFDPVPIAGEVSAKVGAYDRDGLWFDAHAGGIVYRRYVDGVGWRWPAPSSPSAPAPEGADPIGARCMERIWPHTAPQPRLCIGIPGQSPSEACDAVLGRDQIGNRCTICERWMHVHGRCDGCMSKRDPAWTVTGELCADCRIDRQSQRALEIEEREQARANARERVGVSDIDQAILTATEAAWVALAESADLDPRTVAVCKRLRDLERAVCS